MHVNVIALLCNIPQYETAVWFIILHHTWASERASESLFSVAKCFLFLSDSVNFCSPVGLALGTESL